VLSPPAAAEAVRPVQQATNAVIKAIANAATPAGSGSDKSTDPKETISLAAVTKAKEAPGPKMYCN
jgi:hypothetical protein